MKRAIGSPNAAQRRRHDAIAEIGCVACWMDGRGGVRGEVHHLTMEGRHGAPQLGHSETVALCPWHHRGVPPEGYTKREARDLFGVSFAVEPSLFRLSYGRQEVLLEFQNALLERHRELSRLRPVTANT